MSTVNIDLDAGACNGKVVVDGHDISAAVRAVDVRARVGEITVVEVALIVTKHTQIDATDALVTIPTATRTALVALGWTPPAGEECDAPLTWRAPGTVIVGERDMCLDSSIAAMLGAGFTPDEAIEVVNRDDGLGPTADVVAQ